MPVNQSADTGGFINTAFDANGGTINGRTRIVWAACRTHGVYRSTDGGDSFSLVGPQTQPVYYNTAVCDAAGTFYVAAGSNTNNDGKIYKCPRGGTSLVDITPFATGVWQTIDVHPSDQRLSAQTALVRTRVFLRRRQHLVEEHRAAIGLPAPRTSRGTRPPTAPRAWSGSPRARPISCGSPTATAAWDTARALGARAT